MASPNYRYVTKEMVAGVLVLAVTEPQLQGDSLADTMRKEFLEITSAEKAANVVIDMRRVKYISSAAFRPFLSLKREVQKANGKVVLCGMSPVVSETFLQLRLTSNNKLYHAPFETRADVAAAVAFLNGKETEDSQLTS